MAANEESSSSLKRQGTKRKAPSNSEDGGSGSTSDANINIDSRPNSLSQSDSVGCPVNESSLDIQQCASSWTQDTLDTLKISSELYNKSSASHILFNLFLPSLSPVVFIHDGIAANHELSFVENLVESCIENLEIEKSPLKHLDVDDITEISCSLAYKLMFLKHKSKEGEPRVAHKRQLNSWNLTKSNKECYPYQEYFCQMFYTHGHRFSLQLMDICAEIKKGITEVPESMYEALFQEFAGMFGVLSKKQHKDTVFQLGSKHVTSKPDIVFPFFKDSEEEDIKILALCQVIPGFKARSCSYPTGRYIGLNHELTKSLLGQHGGILLSHLLQSPNYALLGLIVQRTSVTFSYLSCSPEELEHLKTSGKPSESQTMRVYYSYPYNYLRAEDRKELIKIFLTLGLIQLTPFV